MGNLQKHSFPGHRSVDFGLYCSNIIMYDVYSWLVVFYQKLGAEGRELTTDLMHYTKADSRRWGHGLSPLES